MRCLLGIFGSRFFDGCAESNCHCMFRRNNEFLESLVENLRSSYWVHVIIDRLLSYRVRCNCLPYEDSDQYNNHVFLLSYELAFAAVSFL